MKKYAILMVATIAFSAMANPGGQHQQGKAWQRPAPAWQAKKAEQPKHRQAQGTTLDKAQPTPHPGEGFLINGREGKALDAGRPAGTQPDWDLWRK